MSPVAAVAVGIVRGRVVVRLVGWDSRIWHGRCRQDDGAAAMLGLNISFIIICKGSVDASSDDAVFAPPEVLQERLIELKLVSIRIFIWDGHGGDGTMRICFDVVGMGDRVIRGSLAFAVFFSFSFSF